MHKRDWVVLAVIANYGYMIQRELVERTRFSLGAVNASLKALQEEGYLDKDYALTAKAREHIRHTSPRRAVILAAGPGLRMAPATTVPKGLLHVGPETLIERLIRQLKGVGVDEIYVVVGYMMERFEPLADKYGVTFVFNDDYVSRDSLHSLALVAEHLDNCYVINSDLWFAKNPFSKTEYFSWYAVSELVEDDSYVRINKKMELVYTGDSPGNAMTGLCYLTQKVADKAREKLLEMDRRRIYAKAEWEMALFYDEKMLTYARIMRGQTYFAVKTYPQLQELIEESTGRVGARRNLISRVLDVPENAIEEKPWTQRGMTNRQVLFAVENNKYLLRIPGEGSNALTDRKREAEVYKAVASLGIADEVVYMDPETGYKISRYIENARTCDGENQDDVRRCLELLKSLHSSGAQVATDFDPFRMIERYEKLLGDEVLFVDYEAVRRSVMELEPLLKAKATERCLCHIDPAPQNFLFTPDGNVRLLDWEYGGMGEPMMDIASFCLSAGYDRQKIQQIYEVYTGGHNELYRLYAYCAAFGLLWSLWAEYKRRFGVSFPDYAIKQYGYAKRFAALTKNMSEKEN